MPIVSVDTDLPTNLSNATPALLAKDVIELRDLQKALKKKEGFLAEALKARIKKTHDGKEITLTMEEYKAYFAEDVIATEDPEKALIIKHVTQSRFDTKGFRAADPETAAKWSKPVEMVQLRSYNPITKKVGSGGNEFEG